MLQDVSVLQIDIILEDTVNSIGNITLVVPEGLYFAVSTRPVLNSLMLLHMWVSIQSRRYRVKSCCICLINSLFCPKYYLF